MKYQDAQQLKLPDAPGVYHFLDRKKKILYIGKATSLRDRVRSYFANDLLHTRGKHILDMVASAHTLHFIETDSVLEALILEASLIKKHQPYYNTKEKDNKSFNYVVITNEEFPRVLTIRERTMLAGTPDTKALYKYIFGPFPQGMNLLEALKIIRKIFPFRDTCSPAQTREIKLLGVRKTFEYPVIRHHVTDRDGRVSAGKPCFNRQINLCPGVCTGEISKKEYAETIRNIKEFFEGKKKLILKRLTRDMHLHAKNLEFEKAGEDKRAIFGLTHIKDVSLISENIRIASRDSSRVRAQSFRIEAYDIAHISGKYTVGVMVVVEDDRPQKSAYRKFKIRVDAEKVNDTLHLEEVLRRRFAHHEWPKADLLVIDGGIAQRRVALRLVKEFGLACEVVSVVKDERHKPKGMLGNKEIIESYKRGILIANAESHRFAVAYHRTLREKLPFLKTSKK